VIDPAPTEAGRRTFGLAPGERRAALGFAGFGVLAMLVVVLVRLALDVPVPTLTRDPAFTFDYPDWVGALSHLGVLAWAAAASVALLGASIAAPGEARRFLTRAGLLTVVLAFDDLFQGHENVGGLLFYSGELVIFALYGLAIVLMVSGSRRYIRESTPVAVLAVAAVLLGFSQLIDRFTYLPARLLLEDGSKFLGVLAWLLYLAIVARRECAGAALAAADRARPPAR